MTPTEISLVGFLVLYVVLSLISIGAAYRNGVTDGYGYGREGRGHPGYAKAGKFLRETMAHRWPELRDRNA